MASYVKSAEYRGLSIKFTLVRYQPGTMLSEYNEYIKTRPLGNWSNILFNENDKVLFHSFLNTMVFRNNEVLRKMAFLVHDQFLTDSAESDVWLVDQLRIIDPTFQPGRFNLAAAWQRDLVRDICTTSAIYVIGTCRNNNRLYSYYRAISSKIQL
jgi:hypothetical protein